MNHPWSTWWQTDLPCQFSKERALENCEYLIKTLGSDITKKVESPGAKNHPLFQCWRSNGAMSFLEMNALAEDLRCVDVVPGVEDVIRDLLDSERCKPAWHVIHCSAMFVRGEGNRLVRFLPADIGKVSRFLIGT